MSFSIAGKTAIVTGGANGIGLAIGRHFADAGANVMFADMDEKRLTEELGEQADDSNIRYFAGDLREKLTIANLLSATHRCVRSGGYPGQWRSAGDDPSDPLDTEDDSVRTLLNQNLMPALRLSQLVAKRMIKQADDRDDENPAGSIINLSSIAARRTHPDLMAYSVSTAALDQMTRSLAVALAPNRIRVNSIALGSVMSASLQSTLKENRDFRDDIEKAHSALARIAAPNELTETAQFLASDAAGFITGQILTIDGGRTLLDPVAAPAH